MSVEVLHATRKRLMLDHYFTAYQLVGVWSGAIVL